MKTQFSILNQLYDKFIAEDIPDNSVGCFIDGAISLRQSFSDDNEFNLFLEQAFNINNSFDEAVNILNSVKNNLRIYDIMNYKRRYSYLKDVPERVIGEYLDYLDSPYHSDIKALRLAIFWKNHPELIMDDRFDNSNLYLVSNNINDFNYLDEFLIKYHNFLNLYRVNNILLNWDKLSTEQKQNPGDLLLKHIEGDSEYIKENYPDDLYPILTICPFLVGVNAGLIAEIFNNITKSGNIIDKNSVNEIGKLISIFGDKFYDYVDKDATYRDMQKMSSYYPNFDKLIDYKYMDEFITRFRKYLGLPMMSGILKSWDKIAVESRQHPEKVLIGRIPEVQREYISKNYPVEVWPLLITSPRLIGEDANFLRYISNNIGFNKEITYSDIIGIGKMADIFGEDDFEKYIDLRNLSNPRNIYKYIPDLDDYSYMGDFLIKFREYLDTPIISGILREWNNLDKNYKEDFRELLSYYMPEEGQRLAQRYKVETYPLLISCPSLLGAKETAIESVFNKVIESNKERLTEENIKDIGKLISIFGDRFYNFVQSYNLKDIHNKSNYLPDFEKRSDYKYMDIFLSSNKDWGNSKVNMVIKNWKNFPEEIRRPPQDLDKLYNYLVENIFPEIYKDLKIRDKDFAHEALQHGIPIEYYNQYENIYIASQKVPLPRWAEIGSVELGGYRGYFVPRSDPRTMFIGDYITCCQRIGNAAETSAVHSQTSPYGALFLVENINTGKPTAQSWVWENKGNIVFDNIECVAMKGEDPNDKIAELIMGVYKEAARRIKGLGMKSVSVGYAEYGIDTKYLDDLPEMKDDFIEGPEDEKEFTDKYSRYNNRYEYEEGEGELYMDSDEGKRILAKVIRISNRIDGGNSRISDKIDRLIFGWENV